MSYLGIYVCTYTHLPTFFFVFGRTRCVHSVGKIDGMSMICWYRILKIYQFRYFINNNIGIVFVLVFDIHKSWTDH